MGFLNAAFGAGGLLGGMAGLALVSLRRLARPFAAGLVMWGVPLTLIGIWPQTAWTVACLAVVGAGNAVLAIAGFTLIQRGIDDLDRGRSGLRRLRSPCHRGARGGSTAGAAARRPQPGPRSAPVVAGSILPVL